MIKHFPLHSSLGLLGNQVQRLPALVGARGHLSGAPDSGASLSKSSSLPAVAGEGQALLVGDSSPQKIGV